MIATPSTPFSGRSTIKTPPEIGGIIRQLRKEAKLTQADAAAMCRVGTRFLSDLENGKASLHLGKVLQVLRNFGLQVILKKKDLSHE
jgi:y4mF family transcriptional regulator